jgi:hypothetical protein
VLRPAERLARHSRRRHDFWIEPSTYRPEPLQRVTLRHRVGNHFLGDPVPRDEGLMVRFVTLGGDGEKRVPGVHGVDPAGIAQAPETGTLVVAYQSRGSVVELPPDKMARYAEEEGVAAQLPAGWQGKPLLRDSFARSVKSLLVVSGRGSAGFDRTAGLPLELVPLVDPAGSPPAARCRCGCCGKVSRCRHPGGGAVAARSQQGARRAHRRRRTRHLHAAAHGRVARQGGEDPAGAAGRHGGLRERWASLTFVRGSRETGSVGRADACAREERGARRRCHEHVSHRP